MARSAAPKDTPDQQQNEVANNEPKTLGDVLDQLPVSPSAILPEFTPPPLRLGVFQAISMVMSELGEIGIAKAKEATEGGRFKYRGIDQVYEALNKLLVKHHLVILPRYRDRIETERKTGSGKAIFDVTLTGDYQILCTIDGSSTFITTYGEAFDTGDKATNKSMSVAYKYAAFQLFCIPVEGENTDDADATQNHDIVPKGGAGKAQPQQQQPQLTEEERHAEYKKRYDAAEALILACTTKVEIDNVWNKKIDWSGIPKGWVPRLDKIAKDHEEAIARPRRGNDEPSETTRVATKPPVFDTTLDDDIPF